MNALFSGCLTLVVGLAGGLVASPAEARETPAAPAAVAPKSTSQAPGRDRAARSAANASKKGAAKKSAGSLAGNVARPRASSSPLLGAVSPRDAAVATVVASAESEAAAEEAAPTAPEPARQLPKQKGGGNKFLLFTDGLLEDMGELPVLGMFILPVTEGVTIPTFEGPLTSLTLAVKPTKIARGSGVVAIGTFD
jgi:hypothetical protein